MQAQMMQRSFNLSDHTATSSYFRGVQGQPQSYGCHSSPHFQNVDSKKAEVEQNGRPSDISQLGSVAWHNENAV